MVIFLLPFMIGSLALTVQETWSRRRRGAVERTDVILAKQTQPAVTHSFSTAKVRNWLEPRSNAEAALFGELKLVWVGAVFATGGLFFFPLQIVGILCIVPTLAYFVAKSYHQLRYEKRFSADAASTVFQTGALAGGYFFALNLAACSFVLVRWLALKTEAQSKEQIVDLFGQQSRSAWVVVDGAELEIPLEQVRVGDLVAVQGGQTIPTDGIVIEGHASIDQHILTGEARPVESGPGDRVLAATMVRAGRILIRVDRAGGDTTAAQVAHMLTNTSDYTAGLTSRADALNDKLALPFVVVSACGLPFIGIGSALALLGAMPGYRMVLFGPLSMLSYLHLAAKEGILVKDGRSLESLQDVDTVMFDKTGTLTMEQPHVSKIIPCPEFSRDEVLTFAAAAETKQSHPIARAILEAATVAGIVITPVDQVDHHAGYGIATHINGSAVLVGSFRYMDLNGIEIPPMIQAAENEAHNKGHSLVLVAADGKLAGGIVLEPSIRKEAVEIIAQLQKRGLKIYIVSGDRDAPTRHLAQYLGIDYFAEVLPGDKANLVKLLQAEGRKVCFVGDGINDSIALKSANVSVSMSGATTVAVDTAQIVLMDGSLAQLPHVFQIAEEFRMNMRVNLLASTVPCGVMVVGALFFGLTLLPAMLIYQISLPFGLYNVLRPLFPNRRESGRNGATDGNREDGLLTGPTGSQSIAHRNAHQFDNLASG